MNDLNCAVRIRNSSKKGNQEAERKALERRLHALHHSPQVHANVAGDFGFGQNVAYGTGDPAQIFSGWSHVNVHGSLNLIVVDFGRGLNLLAHSLHC